MKFLECLFALIVNSQEQCLNASKNAPSKNYLNFAVLGDAKWNTLNESFKQIEISREAIAQAEENLRILSQSNRPESVVQSCRTRQASHPIREYP